MKKTCLAIVLAAGEGTRMRSARPKVLHAIAGRSLLAHVLAAVRGAGIERTAVVVGPDAEAVADEARHALPKAEVFVQAERRGTAHAVLAARAAIEQGADDILVIFGDTPLLAPETLKAMRGAIAHGASIAVLGFRPADPTGYGRLITNGHRLVAIREERDASDIERKIDLCNGGAMALRGEVALEILDRIGDTNAKGEFYLTDAVTVADGMALEAVALETREDEVLGVDNRAKLARGEAMMQQRLRAAALDAGVTMVAPETVFLCADTEARPRRRGRAACGVRAGRHGGGGRGDPRLLASRRRACGEERVGRTLRAAAAGRAARHQIAHRQFRRGEGGRDRRGRQGEPPRLYRRRQRRRRREHRGRHDLLQLRRQETNTAPWSARARSWARTPHWWRR